MLLYQPDPVSTSSVATSKAAICQSASSVRPDGIIAFTTGYVDHLPSQLYIVHMKHVTASEARKHWFTLLDEVAKVEIVAIQRNEHTLILRAEKRKASIPNYKGLIGGKDLENADKWGWDWSPSKGLVPVTRR